MSLPGHCSVLQFWSSELSPTHKLSATGELFASWHCLVLDCVPVPQISVHTLQSSQSDQAAKEKLFYFTVLSLLENKVRSLTGTDFSITIFALRWTSTSALPLVSGTSQVILTRPRPLPRPRSTELRAFGPGTKCAPSYTHGDR